MADSFVTYTGDGVQTNWAVPFPYIDQSHVHFYVNGVEVTTGLSWPNANTITVTPAVASGSAIKIARLTPHDPLVVFADRNNLTAENFNLLAEQSLYLSIEATDQASAIAVDTIQGNVAQADADAAAAAASQIAAAASATAAANSATASAASAAEAAASAASLDTSTLLAKANNLSELTDVAQARTNLGLATVASSGAYSDLSGLPVIGTGANDLVQLDASAKLPAVDGSQLTGLPFSKEGSPASQLYTVVGQVITFAHGLGVVPKLVQLRLECQTNDAGYVAGDVILISSGVENDGNGTSHIGLTAKIDATNVTCKVAANGINVINASTGAFATATPNNWKMGVSAFA